MKNLDNITYSSILVLTAGGVILGGTIANSVFLGLTGAASVGLILIKFKKSFPKIYKFILRHDIMSDIVFSLLLLLIIGTSTVTSVLGAMAASLLASCGILYLKRQSEIEFGVQ
jgi:hypothetical protein